MRFCQWQIAADSRRLFSSYLIHFTSFFYPCFKCLLQKPTLVTLEKSMWGWGIDLFCHHVVFFWCYDWSEISSFQRGVSSDCESHATRLCQHPGCSWRLSPHSARPAGRCWIIKTSPQRRFILLLTSLLLFLKHFPQSVFLLFFKQTL